MSEGIAAKRGLTNLRGIHTVERMIPSPRVTMLDVAHAAGCDRSTVSLALRHDRRIPEATRTRIAEIAERLGYRPHPLLSALGAARRARRPPSLENGTTLAFIISANRKSHIRDEHVAGARAAAAAQGYSLETFVVGDAGLTAARLNTILLTRNIHGVIIAPLPEAHGHFDLEWEKFSVVVIEYTFTTPAFDRVVHDNYDGMRVALAHCRERALSRAGLVLTTVGHERTEGLNGAAFWLEQKAAPQQLAAIPPLYLPEWDAETFTAWRRRHGVEAVITSSSLMEQIHALLRSESVEVPGKVSLININCMPTDRISGIEQNNTGIGANAVRMVIDKLNRNDLGIPALRQTVLIPGRWREGKTCA
ncbi:LacI family DNA-binding transcriptional regulator [Geminisphaera colitermitum]|uniref:LacI family DNA-binding transcriptional regulator n=1 Tax=Geminisphaera colitermitum TaxID=1148786 RepID=UPI000196509A|nr:LacI family DNA-binding transcriptional regulator [Geminisphaera colitermitum]